MKLRFLLILGMMVWIFWGCKQQDEKLSLTILGNNLAGGYYYFEGEIDKDTTPYCGQASPVSTTSPDSSTTPDNNTQTTQYDIDSYYRFKYGDYMQIRYTYDINRRKYTLVPTTTTISVCNTTDFINCDTNGTATCETADGIKCGGTKTFIFVGILNPIQFQAVSGSIDWSKGFSLTSDNQYVQRATIEFRMVDKNSNILEGKIFCYSRL